MDDKNIKKVIDYGIDRYFEVKADKETKAKLAAEADEQKKKTSKEMEKNIALVMQIALIVIVAIGCYIFLRNMGAL